MNKTLSVRELVPGMFVVRITKQQAQIAVNHEGWVRTQGSIQKLIELGIEEVVIDTSKSLESEKEPESAVEVIEEKVNFDEEVERSYKIYNDAKNLQSKLFNDLASGKPLEFQQVAEATKGIVDTLFKSKDTLLFASQIRIKDEYLLQHSLNVSIFMAAFAKYLKFDPELIHHLAVGAFLHDVGKVKIPSEILNKPGALTPEEFNIMKTHVNHSVDALGEMEGLHPISREIVAYHHERLDGQGYPFNKQDSELSQYVRMINIVDVYDALTADRCYKKAALPSTALKFLMKGGGKLFDAGLVTSFIKCVGLYPVGTLVKMRSGKLGIVTQSNDENPLKPIIKIFYSTREKHYTNVKDMDLAQNYCNDMIECSVKPDEFKINLKSFFEQMILG